MKKFLKILSLFTLVLLIGSCEPNNEENVNYTPREYIQPGSLSIAIDNVSFTTLDLNFSSTNNDDVVYYSFQLSSAQEPSVLSLVSQNSPNAIENGALNLSSMQTVMLSNLMDATEYTLYAVNSSVDGTLSDLMSATDMTLTCPINISSSYTGDGYSNEIDVTAGSFPAYTVDFVPVMGEDNMWTLETTWGPNFVNLLSNGGAPPGAFPYPSTVTLMEDNSVIVTGGAAYATGGTGTYDACTDTFTLNLTQGLFQGDFTVDVVLIGN